MIAVEVLVPESVPISAVPGSAPTAIVVTNDSITDINVEVSGPPAVAINAGLPPLIDLGGPFDSLGA